MMVLISHHLIIMGQDEECLTVVEYCGARTRNDGKFLCIWSQHTALFYIENMGKDWVPLVIMIFYYGDRAGNLRLTVDEYFTTLGPGKGMMANFSISGPNMLFYMENMGRDWVPLPYVIF